MEETMRALVWNQPFGSAMLGCKSDETRFRPTNVRGEILICTAKKAYPESEVQRIVGPKLHPSFQYELRNEKTLGLNGYAIGVGELYDCIPMEAEHEYTAWVQWSHFTDRWCWRFRNVRRIKPFEWKFGKQGWLFVPVSEMAKIEYV
jgi:hypothetical protein